jgi:hypothetical protein
MSYTSTMTGRVPKVVDCENCQKQYVYFLERTVTGEATSFLFLENEEAKQRAAEYAQAELQNRLARVCDPVPCPRCGHYQQHMLKKAKSLHRAWMFNAGLAGIVLAAPLAIAAALFDSVAQQRGDGGAQDISYVLFTLTVVGAVAGIALLVWRFLATARYDPNDAPVGVRIEDGRDRALTAEEYVTIVERQRGSEGPSQAQQAV